MSDAHTKQSLDPAVMAVVVEVRTQLGAIHATLEANQRALEASQHATNMRIDDMRTAIGSRLEGHDQAIHTLQANERATAIKAASAGAVAGTGAALLVNALISAIRGRPH